LERTVYASLAAVVAVAAPILFYLFTLPHGIDDRWLIPWILAPILGSMVFELIRPPRSGWKSELTPSAILAVAFGLWAGLQPPTHERGTWPSSQLAFIGAIVFVGALSAGVVGGLAAKVVTYLVGRRRAWKAGVAIAVLDVVVSAILVAVLG
jgi:H+/Cl- antiporter ClcA